MANYDVSNGTNIALGRVIKPLTQPQPLGMVGTAPQQAPHVKTLGEFMSPISQFRNPIQPKQDFTLSPANNNAQLESIPETVLSNEPSKPSLLQKLGNISRGITEERNKLISKLVPGDTIIEKGIEAVSGIPQTIGEDVVSTVTSQKYREERAANAPTDFVNAALIMGGMEPSLFFAQDAAQAIGLLGKKGIKLTAEEFNTAKNEYYQGLKTGAGTQVGGLAKQPVTKAMTTEGENVIPEVSQVGKGVELPTQATTGAAGKGVEASGVPPKIPTETGAGLSDDDIIRDFGNIIRSPESADFQKLIEQSRAKQLSQRLTKLQARTQELIFDKKLSVEEAMKQAQIETMSGKFDMPVVGAIKQVTDDYRDALMRRLHEVLKNDPLERMSTLEALSRALAGDGIPRKPGIAGGSAYSRLTKIFPADVIELLDKKKPLDQIMADNILSKKVPGTGLTPQEIEEIRNYKNVPYGQARLGEKPFEFRGVKDTSTTEQDRAWFKLKTEYPGEIAQAREPFVPSPKALSGEQQLGLGDLGAGRGAYEIGTPQDLRHPEQKAFDYMKLQAAVQRAEGKLPETTIPKYEPPIDTVIKQPGLMPMEERNAVVEVLKEAGWTAIDIGNFLRANQASFDLSWWRQQAPLIFNNKTAFIKANATTWKVLKNKAYAAESLTKIQSHPYYKYYEQLDLDFIRPLIQKGVPEWKRTEQFMVLGSERPISKLAGKLPWLTKSQEVFVTATNEMNWEIFCKYVDDVLKMNEQVATGAIKLKPNEAININKQIQTYGRMLQDMTGRAQLGPLKSVSPAMNAGFFSLRYNLARLITPRHLISTNPQVRKAAWMNLTTFIGGIAGIELAGEALGLWEIEKNPTSADFMKIRMGKVRLDPWGGYQQFVRLYATLIKREGKSATTGNTYPIDPVEAMTNFVRTKFSPLAQFLTNAWTGKNFIGEPYSVKDPKGYIGMLTPFALQDIYSAFKEQGIEGLLTGGTTIFGVGYGSYDSPDTTSSKTTPKYKYKPKSLKDYFAQ